MAPRDPSMRRGYWMNMSVRAASPSCHPSPSMDIVEKYLQLGIEFSRLKMKPHPQGNVVYAAEPSSAFGWANAGGGSARFERQLKFLTCFR